ncbi:MAG TPA: hypothetical protein VF870_13835 [Ignavibacteriaceae bacterium]
MKKIFLALMLILVSSLTAQVRNISERQYFRQSDWEVASSFAIGLSKTTYESTSQNYYAGGSSDEQFYSEISLAIGFFILEGLSIEPELDYNFFQDDATFSMIANISYTLHIPKKSIYPFFKVGYGKSGFRGYSYSPYPDNSEGLFGSLNANLINASAGLKIIQSSSFAMILELNYKYITFNQTVSTDYAEPYNVDTKTSALSIKIGGSFLL